MNKKGSPQVYTISHIEFLRKLIFSTKIRRYKSTEYLIRNFWRYAILAILFNIALENLVRGTIRIDIELVNTKVLRFTNDLKIFGNDINIVVKNSLYLCWMLNAKKGNGTIRKWE